jgi:SAM-dependent methyltransferase
MLLRFLFSRLITQASQSQKKEDTDVDHHPLKHFTNSHYQRINQRRLEHLASLHLPLENTRVLEVGAGIGDLTSFFLDRQCEVVTSEGRPVNLALLRQRYPHLPVLPLDLENPPEDLGQRFDVVFCYGVLYHLSQPAKALAFLARHCEKMLLLETCVSYGEEPQLNLCSENATIPTQSLSGFGCRPTRLWVYQHLTRHFPYVYVPRTQPYHPEFPSDWRTPPKSSGLTRAIFIASRQSINNPLLTTELLPQQERYFPL